MRDNEKNVLVEYHRAVFEVDQAIKRGQISVGPELANHCVDVAVGLLKYRMNVITTDMVTEIQDVSRDPDFVKIEKWTEDKRKLESMIDGFLIEANGAQKLSDAAFIISQVLELEEDPECSFWAVVGNACSERVRKLRN